MKLFKRALTVYAIGVVGALITFIISERNIRMKVEVDNDVWLAVLLAILWPGAVLVVLLGQLLERLGLMDETDYKGGYYGNHRTDRHSSRNNRWDGDGDLRLWGRLGCGSLPNRFVVIRTARFRGKIQRSNPTGCIFSCFLAVRSDRNLLSL